MNRTLAAVPGTLGRLIYLGRLRHDGRGQHWGLARVHGEHAVAAAIAETHTEIWLQALRTPLPALFPEWQRLESELGAEPENAARLVDRLMPANVAGGARRHFSSILLSLSLLSQAAKAANRPAA